MLVCYKWEKSIFSNQGGTTEPYFQAFVPLFHSSMEGGTEAFFISPGNKSDSGMRALLPPVNVAGGITSQPAMGYLTGHQTKKQGHLLRKERNNHEHHAGL